MRRARRRKCAYIRPPVACQYADGTRTLCKADDAEDGGGPDPDGCGGCANWTPCDLKVGYLELSVSMHRSLCKAPIRAIREWMREVSPHLARSRAGWSWEAALRLACEARDAVAYWDGVEQPSCRAMEQEAAHIEALILHVEGLR